MQHNDLIEMVELENLIGQKAQCSDHTVATSATDLKKLTLTEFPERDDVQRLKHTNHE